MKIEKIKKIEEEKVNAKGNAYKRGGICVDGVWYNGFVNPAFYSTYETLRSGDNVDNIELSENEKDGKVYKNFNFLSAKKKQEKEVQEKLSKYEELEEIVFELKNRIDKIEKSLSVGF